MVILEGTVIRYINVKILKKPLKDMRGFVFFSSLRFMWFFSSYKQDINIMVWGSVPFIIVNFSSGELIVFLSFLLKLYY
jgi:hypothetical protein